MRTPRRRSREFAVQALYQSILNPEYSVTEIIQNIKTTETFINALEEKKPKVDEALFLFLIEGIFRNRKQYETVLIPFLDISFAELNPIELAILLIACHELETMPETPYPVIINEAVELTKVYAKEDSYKFINGVLDKMAIQLRSNDIS